MPLGEDGERYEVDILDGAAVKRTLVSGTTSATYTAAQQMADFGFLPPLLGVRVYQVSTVWGRGSARDATV